MFCCIPAVRSATKQILRAEPCQYLRIFHTTQKSLAKRTPRPSPRVQAAQRAAQRKEDGDPRETRRPINAHQKKEMPGNLYWQQNHRTWSIAKLPEGEISVPTYKPSLVKGIIAGHRFVESEQHVQAFMKAWDAELVKHRGLGPWIDDVVNKYNISHETLYALGSFRRGAANARLLPSLQLSMLILVEAASRRGNRLATILNANGLLGDPNFTKHELFKTYKDRLEIFAKGEDRQCMTMLAMLERQSGNTEKAQRLLEAALEWDEQPYTPCPPRSGTTSSLSNKEIEDHIHANEGEFLDSYLNSLMWEKRKMFPGIVEAMYTLGMIYLGQINSAVSRNAQSTQYFKEAFAIFNVCYFWLRDTRGLKQIIMMTPGMSRARLAMAEQSAVHGDVSAWKLLAQSTETHGGTAASLGPKNPVGLTSKSNGESMLRNQTRMIEEWKSLVEYHHSVDSET